MDPVAKEVFLWRARAFRKSRQAAVKVGQALSDIVLSRSVQTLLTRSLGRIRPGNGIRPRLRLDESLVDLPREFLRKRSERT